MSSIWQKYRILTLGNVIVVDERAKRGEHSLLLLKLIKTKNSGKFSSFFRNIGKNFRYFGEKKYGDFSEVFSKITEIFSEVAEKTWNSSEITEKLFSDFGKVDEIPLNLKIGPRHNVDAFSSTTAYGPSQILREDVLS